MVFGHLQMASYRLIQALAHHQFPITGIQDQYGCFYDLDKGPATVTFMDMFNLAPAQARRDAQRVGTIGARTELPRLVDCSFLGARANCALDTQTFGPWIFVDNQRPYGAPPHDVLLRNYTDLITSPSSRQMILLELVRPPLQVATGEAQCGTPCCRQGLSQPPIHTLSYISPTDPRDAACPTGI